MLCPRCLENELHEESVMNALSIVDSKTYICSDCGNDESFIQLGDRVKSDRTIAFEKSIIALGS